MGSFKAAMGNKAMQAEGYTKHCYPIQKGESEQPPPTPEHWQQCRHSSYMVGEHKKESTFFYLSLIYR